MYYVVHKFPNLSKAIIHLGTHAHSIANGKCRESFQEMKNMVEDKVCHTPTTTTSTIALFTNKTFLSCHLFKKDGQGLVELLKGEKLQMLLKFSPLCSPSIRNLIASLKHRPNNFESIDCILKLKALSGYDYIQDNYFFSQHVSRRFICSRCPLMELCSDLIKFDKCNQVMIYKMCG
jgi:hypothetical protein